MGSWANSIHVRCDDSTAAADAIRSVMLASGYEPTDEAPDPDDWGIEAALRAVRVAEARDGWVGVLDNDVAEFAGLAAALSDQLATAVIAFLVNDSDSWHYMLFDRGDLVDEFDSVDEEALQEWFASDEANPDWERLQSRLAEVTTDFQQKLMNAMPPEIRAIYKRLLAGEHATPEEAQLYTQWAGEHLPSMQQQFESILAEITTGASMSVVADSDSAGDAQMTGEPAEVPGDDEPLKTHLSHLQPLMVNGVASDLVIAALSAHSVFAEDDLRHFLPLIGIAPAWAGLSYRYWAEFTPDELAREGVRLAEHLTFRAADRS